MKKKLVLHRETLKHLSDSRLPALRGGCTDECDTRAVHTCPVPSGELCFYTCPFVCG